MLLQATLGEVGRCASPAEFEVVRTDPKYRGKMCDLSESAKMKIVSYIPKNT
jgi:hypothetical protein